MNRNESPYAHIPAALTFTEADVGKIANLTSLEAAFDLYDPDGRWPAQIAKGVNDWLAFHVVPAATVAQNTSSGTSIVQCEGGYAEFCGPLEQRMRMEQLFKLALQLQQISASIDEASK